MTFRVYAVNALDAQGLGFTISGDIATIFEVPGVVSGCLAQDVDNAWHFDIITSDGSIYLCPWAEEAPMHTTDQALQIIRAIEACDAAYTLSSEGKIDIDALLTLLGMRKP